MRPRSLRAVGLAGVLLLTVSLLAQALPAEPPAAPQPTPVDPRGVPPDLADWTPRPAVGKSEPWEKMRDPDWVDTRLRSMNTGPSYNGTFRFPQGKVQEYVYKGTAVKLGEIGNAAALFDRCTIRWAAGWTDAWLAHSERRFGLLNTPTPGPGHRMIFTADSSPGWTDAQGRLDALPKATAPLAPEHARYLGHYVHNERIIFSYTVHGVRVLDSIKQVSADGQAGMIRTVQIDPHKQPFTMKVDHAKTLTCPPDDKVRTFIVVYGEAIAGSRADDLTALTKPGPAKWGKPLITKLERGADSGPFAIDTLTLPYDNPHKALFFCTGLDFLPDGRIALCTCHGDVWLAKVDEAAATVAWQRFATGLYHPLGLKVVDGKVIVLERGQLTRLHDANGDGEADFYECLCNLWHTGPGEHAYDTCLETDAQGNFYFFKTGDTDLPSGGCLLKVSADGRKVETYATGFRHPIGLGMSPDGVLTGADQEGNWMPATRVDQYQAGGFYGDMRGHHRDTPPKTYDPPLCWLPREVDNSAGGQVWVPKNSESFKPLAGLPLHLSYGRCKAYVLLRQELPGGGVQGGVADLGLRFLSGSCRGRFHPQDGYLYVCGLNGWQTAAKKDGSLQRVRATGRALDVPVKLKAVAEGVKVTFTRPLNKKLAEDPANYRAAAWNYRWSADYGSKRWKLSNPDAEGIDDLTITGARMLEDRTVLVQIRDFRPAMQVQLGYNLAALDGTRVYGSLYLTIHQLGK